MTRVLVTGAAGRMGREVVRAVAAADGLELVALVDPNATGTTLPSDLGCDLAIVADLGQAIAETRPDVMVDFTHPSVVEGNIGVALGAGVNCVIGTTGLSEERLAELAKHAVNDACLFFAPNFAIGAVLMMRFAEQAARYLPHVEITELHHDKKADAPSGTAIRTARLIAAARGETPEAPGRDTEVFVGARGALVDGVYVHSVRLPGLVAHQEIIFGGQGQTLTIRHDSIDRTSFMPGVVLACSQVASHSGLIVGLERFMGE